MAKREREITENASLLKVKKQKPESLKSRKGRKSPKGQIKRKTERGKGNNSQEPRKPFQFSPFCFLPSGKTPSLPFGPFRPLGPSPML